ncbi:MAG: FG-GAP repeat protein, partial [Planctomycetota bacterium]
DVDGDGIVDLVWGNPSYFEQSGGVYVLSGIDGRELWRFAPLRMMLSNGFEVEMPTGTSIAVLADLDHDGVKEILVGAGSYTDESGLMDNGAVLILSGRTGLELHRIEETAVKWPGQ